MKVLLVADEYFSWGVHGGFGAFTRKLGKELVNQGVTVEAIVQRIAASQKPVGCSEVIDGVEVTTLPRKKLQKHTHLGLYRTDADIIHSQCGMYDTYLAFENNSAKKIVTVQDLRTIEERDRLLPLEKYSVYPWYKALWARYVRRCYKRAMETSDIIACQAHLLFPKVREAFGVSADLMLPNFIDIPTTEIKKSKDPSVVWLARLDPIKQPEACFDLAERTPDVDFNILGSSHTLHGGTIRDDHFKEKYSHVKNLRFHGFTTGEEKERILRESWILINTSAYECLPVSFLEGMAHKCAILSNQNPDHYTTHYGAWVSPYTDFDMKLVQLLKDDHWKEQGERGYDYVKKNHSTEYGVGRHISLYKDLVED